MTPLVVQRKARNLIADQLDGEGRHDDARLTRAGMRDNAASKVLAETLMLSAAREMAAERHGQIAGTLFGVFVGFVVGIILLA